MAVLFKKECTLFALIFLITKTTGPKQVNPRRRKMIQQNTFRITKSLFFIHLAVITPNQLTTRKFPMPELCVVVDKYMVDRYQLSP